ncbi:pentapeptide repeat-containing protein [Nocardia callitridis]
MGWVQWDRRLRRPALLRTVSAVLVGLVVAALTWLVVGAPSSLDYAEIGVLVVAGLLGAGVFGIAVRWHGDRERARFAQLYGAAVGQLGDADPAVRIAGVHAMAGVADHFTARHRRQQCVDALCGYLRMPYDPAFGDNHLAARGETSDEAGTGVERIYKFRRNDAVVRRTIVEVIAARLRPAAETSWSGSDFTFDGAVFEAADFRHTVFGGRRTSFAGATFTGPTTFEHARFTGQQLTFRAASFDAQPVSFAHVRFGAKRADKSDPLASGTDFDGAAFAGSVSFADAEFLGPRTSFAGARWTGAETTFRAARFAATQSSFAEATFDGDRVVFTEAHLSGTRIVFAGTRFYATTVDFDKARVGAPARSRNRGTHLTDACAAEFHGAFTFTDTVFAGRRLDFGAGDFFGEISFVGAEFEAEECSFESPKAWVGVEFDWDDAPTAKPARVLPDPWPPTPDRK